MSMKISLLPDPTVTTSIVLIDETVSGTTTSVQYLNLGVDSSGKVRLLRVYTIGSWGSGTSYNTIETWLENTFINYFDNATKSALSSTSIVTIVDSQIVEIAKSVFSLSDTELGNGGNYGVSILDVLKSWKNTTNDSTARIATDVVQTAKQYFLRPSGANIVNGIGRFFSAGSEAQCRPCLSFNPDTLVTDPDENGICYLLPDPDKPYRPLGLETLIGTPTVTPVEGILQVNATGMINNYPKAYFTTNYVKNATDDWYEVPIGRPFDIIGNGKNLGVKIEGRTESRGVISEPILNTGGEKDET